jgi:hypothetical protein
MRFVLLLSYFVVVGPPVGSVVFFTLMAIMNIQSPIDAAYALFGPFVGLLFAPFSYLLGTLPAALGGVFVAAWQAFFGRVSGIGITLLAFVLGLVFVFATGGIGGLTQKTVDWGAVVAAQLTAMVPTVVCWYPVRNRFYPLPDSETSAGGAKP